MKRFKIVICLFGILAGFMFFINPVVSKAKEPLTLNIIENDWPPYYFASYIKNYSQHNMTYMDYISKMGFIKRLPIKD